MNEIQYVWHGRRYWTMEPQAHEQIGWNTCFEICFVVRKTAKRIYIKSPTLGDMQLNRQEFERDGKVYHSKPHEWFYRVKPSVDPEKPGKVYYDFMARLNGTPEACATLGIAPGCSKAEIKRAYRRKAKACHPDTGGSSDAFVRLNRAYESLMEKI